MKTLSKLKKRILTAIGVAFVMIGMAFNIGAGINNIGGMDVLLSNIEGLASLEAYCIYGEGFGKFEDNGWCENIYAEYSICVFVDTWGIHYGAPTDCKDTIFISK